MNTQVLGISVDSVPCLTAWAESLGKITYPLLSDFYPHGGVAQLYGVLRPEGTSERAIFVIDKTGLIRYVDVHDIELQPDNEVLFAELARLEPQAAATWKPTEPPPSPEPRAEVVMYCTPWCPGCRRARAYLEEKGIAYVEVDISKDRTAAARVREWANGFETTPTFNIRGQILVNFDQFRLEKLLAKK
jgi:glutaredoxin